MADPSAAAAQSVPGILDTPAPGEYQQLLADIDQIDNQLAAELAKDTPDAVAIRGLEARAQVKTARLNKLTPPPDKTPTPQTPEQTAATVAATKASEASTAKTTQETKDEPLTTAAQLAVAQAQLAKTQADIANSTTSATLERDKFTYEQQWNQVQMLQKQADNEAAIQNNQLTNATSRQNSLDASAASRSSSAMSAASSYRANAFDFISKLARDMPKGSSLAGNAIGELLTNADLLQNIGASAQAYADKTGQPLDDGFHAVIQHLGASAAKVDPNAAAAGTGSITPTLPANFTAGGAQPTMPGPGSAGFSGGGQSFG
jgi:chemotaxis protein histidine kinase CheA